MKNTIVKWLLRAAVAFSCLFLILLLALQSETIQSAIAKKAARSIEQNHGLVIDFESLSIRIWNQQLALENCSVRLASTGEHLVNVETIRLGSWYWKEGNWQLGDLHLIGGRLNTGEIMRWNSTRNKKEASLRKKNTEAALDHLLIENFAFQIETDSMAFNGILERFEVQNIKFIQEYQHAELVDLKGFISGDSIGNDSLKLSKFLGVWNSEPTTWSFSSMMVQSNLFQMQGEAYGRWETDTCSAFIAETHFEQKSDLSNWVKSNSLLFKPYAKWGSWGSDQLKKSNVEGDIMLSWKKDGGWESTFKNWTGLPGVETLDSVQIGKTKEGIWMTSGRVNGNNFGSLMALQNLPIQNPNKHWLDSLKTSTSPGDRWSFRWSGDDYKVQGFYHLKLANHPLPIEGGITFSAREKVNSVEWNGENIPPLFGIDQGYGGTWETSGNFNWTSDSISGKTQINLSNGGLVIATIQANSDNSNEALTRWVSHGKLESQDNLIPLEMNWTGWQSGDLWNWECQGPLNGFRPFQPSEQNDWKLYAHTAIRANGNSTSDCQFAFEMRNINLLENGRPIAFNRMDILGNWSPKSIELTWDSDLTEGHLVSENNSQRWKAWFHKWKRLKMDDNSDLPYFQADCSVRSFVPIAAIGNLPWSIENGSTLHAHNNRNGARLELQIPQFQEEELQVSGVHLTIADQGQFVSMTARCDSLHQKGTTWFHNTQIDLTRDSLWRINTSLDSPTFGHSETQWSGREVAPNHLELQLNKLIIPYENRIIDIEPEPHELNVSMGSSGMQINCKNLNLGFENWSFLTEGTYNPQAQSFWAFHIVGKTLPQFSLTPLRELSANQLQASLEWHQRNGRSSYNGTLKSADLQFKTIKLAGLDFEITGDMADTKYTLEAAIQSKPESKLSAKGQLSLDANKVMHHSVNLEELPLQYLNLMMPAKSVIWDGAITGELNVDGTPHQPKLTGWIASDSAKIQVDYLGTDYTLKGTCRVVPDEFFLDQWEVEDTDGNLARINGTIMHDYFSDWNFDVGLEAITPFQLLKLNREDNDWFYGTAYAKGDVNVFGFDKNLEIEAQLQTSQGTQFSLPLDGASDASYASFIHFQKAHTGPSEIKKRRPDLSRFRVDLNIDVTEDAIARIIFDESVGDEITGVTTGDLSIEINDFEQIEMTGQLKVTKGTYFFTLQNLINKQFNIEPGGTISWFGSPYEAEIDLNTLYTVRTSLDGLLPDESNLPGRVPVQLNLAMQGALMRPEIGFTIKLPEAKPQLQSLLDGAVINDEELNRQALSLLVLNQFLSPDPLSSSFGGTIVQDKSTAFIASQLGHWISQISPDMDIGFDYSNDPSNDDQSLAVALSTRLLDDRLHVEGAVGTNQLSQVSAQNVQLQDMTISYDLDKNGSFQLTGHTRQNPEWSSPYGATTQGVGFRFHREFNQWRKTKKEHGDASQDDL